MNCRFCKKRINFLKTLLNFKRSKFPYCTDCDASFLHDGTFIFVEKIDNNHYLMFYVNYDKNYIRVFIDTRFACSFESAFEFNYVIYPHEKNKLIERVKKLLIFR